MSNRIIVHVEFAQEALQSLVVGIDAGFAAESASQFGQIDRFHSEQGNERESGSVSLQVRLQNLS